MLMDNCSYDKMDDQSVIFYIVIAFRSLFKAYFLLKNPE